MNTIYRKIFLLIPLFMLQFYSSEAQDMEVGVTIGGSYYLGDLNPGKHFLNTAVAYGVVARLNLDTRWAVKISGVRGKIKGNAATSTFLPGRGLAFTSNLTDIAGVVEFNFMQYFTGSRMNPISPYIYGGISAFFFDPVYNGISLRSMGTEGQNIGYEGRSPYGSVSVSVPFGLGVKVSIAKRFGLQVYWEMHKTFNDYLDDVSTTYYLSGSSISPDDESGVLSDPTLNHEPGMQRGSTSNKDWFAFIGMAITYRFNLLTSKKCRDLDH
ncbi:MAG: DUF6089 family protein [Bacteroidales bacterium]|nr:DUF6089 family protein [Bacteroidales bacterium]